MTQTGKIGGVAVVGAGPAGMLAAIRAAEAGADVTVFERNPKVGRKLAISGKGRCNVTNDCAPAEVLSHVLRGEKFLYSSVFRFPPSAVKEFFEDAGVPLKTERGNRVFPVSDRAYDVVDALLRRMREAGVTLRTSARVDSVSRRDDNTFAVVVNGEKKLFRAVIVATGGVSYPLTGSTGDGHRFARENGIGVTPLLPSLVPVETAEDFSPLAGLTLKNVRLDVTAPDGKTVFSQTGEMLFAHFGVTGPLVLSASANMRDHPAGKYKMAVDLKPAVRFEELDARLTKILRDGAAKDLLNAVRGILPAALLPYVIRIAGADGRAKAGNVSAAVRGALCRAIKEFPVTPVRFRPIDEAIVTAGGVSTKELDPKTLESRAVPGLYFAGEVIDADAYTGGFNLQIAFATGSAAGKAAGAALPTK